MDSLVRLFHGGRVKADGEFENMEDEVELFDTPLSLWDLLCRVREKFDGDFTLKGKFDCGRIRAHYVLMRLPNEAHWLRYKKVVEGANVSCLEVVVENGHRKKDLQSVDGIGGDERQARYDVEAPGNLVEDTNLTEEPIQSLPLMCSPVAVEDCRRYSNAVVNNDFDVGTYENDEWEQEEEDNIDDYDATNSENSDEEGDLAGDDLAEIRDVDEVEDGPEEEGNRVEERDDERRGGDELEGSPTLDPTEDGAWMRFNETCQFMPPDSYTANEMRQLRSVHVHVPSVPNYMDISITDKAICDTGLNLARESVYDPNNEIISKGMIFNTLNELKLFLQDYAVKHHRPYTVIHSDQNKRYTIICKQGCLWKLWARRKTNDGKWKIRNVVQPHTCGTSDTKQYRGVYR